MDIETLITICKDRNCSDSFIKMIKLNSELLSSFINSNGKIRLEEELVKTKTEEDINIFFKSNFYLSLSELERNINKGQ